MNKVIAATILSLSTMGYAATVTTAPLQKAGLDSKKPLYISGEGQFACPDGFDLYVRAVKPAEPKDPKNQPPQGDYESFYFARSANGQSAIIVSRPGLQEYVPACISVK